MYKLWKYHFFEIRSKVELHLIFIYFIIIHNEGIRYINYRIYTENNKILNWDGAILFLHSQF